MPIYHTLGSIPRKRHTVFRKPDGGFYAEELMGHEGFIGTSSLLYHTHPPTTVKSARRVQDGRAGRRTTRPSLRHRHFLTARAKKGGSPTLDRMPILFNSDIAMLYVEPDRSDEHFYRNSQADEVVYVVEGQGRARDRCSAICRYEPGDYVVIHRDILHRWRFDTSAGATKLLVFESRGHVRVAEALSQRVRAAARRRAVLRARHPAAARAASRTTRRATSRILVKQYDAINELMLDHHPFDVVGWDGYFYPWAFNIHDFEPIVGRIHQPPPVHQTFQGDGFVICSFCPRPYDFDPERDSGAVQPQQRRLRRSAVLRVERVHEPEGDRVRIASRITPTAFRTARIRVAPKASVGAKYTNELAVMMDSFRPLQVAKPAMAFEDPKYHQSWIESDPSSQLFIRRRVSVSCTDWLTRRRGDEAEGLYDARPIRDQLRVSA